MRPAEFIVLSLTLGSLVFSILTLIAGSKKGVLSSYNIATVSPPSVPPKPQAKLTHTLSTHTKSPHSFTHQTAQPPLPSSYSIRKFKRTSTGFTSQSTISLSVEAMSEAPKIRNIDSSNARDRVLDLGSGLMIRSS